MGRCMLSRQGAPLMVGPAQTAKFAWESGAQASSGGQFAVAQWTLRFVPSASHRGSPGSQHGSGSGFSFSSELSSGLMMTGRLWEFGPSNRACKPCTYASVNMQYIKVLGH